MPIRRRNMNTKFYTLEQNQVEYIRILFEHKIDNEYVILNQFNNLCDIAQYSSKYQNVHLVTVPIQKLDSRKEL